MENNNKYDKGYLKGLITGLLFAVVLVIVFAVAWVLRLNKYVLNYYGLSLSEVKSNQVKLNSDDFDTKMNKLASYIETFYLDDVSEEDMAEEHLKVSWLHWETRILNITQRKNMSRLWNLPVVNIME